jgi:hypothetical protein
MKRALYKNVPTLNQCAVPQITCMSRLDDLPPKPEFEIALKRASKTFQPSTGAPNHFRQSNKRALYFGGLLFRIIRQVFFVNEVVHITTKPTRKPNSRRSKVNVVEVWIIIPDVNRWN